MVTILALITLALAALNTGLAYRTYRSQQGSEKLSGEATEVLRDIARLQATMQELQHTINDRERLLRQKRARTAVQVLVRAIQRQVVVLGDFRNLPPEVDPLEPVRLHEPELAWVPNCEWKTKCQEVLKVGPESPGIAPGQRASQYSTLTNGVTDLQPGGQSRLYEDCHAAINAMT